MSKNPTESRFVKSFDRLSKKHEGRDISLGEYATQVFEQRKGAFIKGLIKRYPPRLLKNALEWYKSLPEIEAAEIPFQEVVIAFAGAEPDQLTLRERKLVIESAKDLPSHPLDRGLPEPEYIEDYGFTKRSEKGPVITKNMSAKEMRERLPKSEQ